MPMFQRNMNTNVWEESKQNVKLLRFIDDFFVFFYRGFSLNQSPVGLTSDESREKL